MSRPEPTPGQLNIGLLRTEPQVGSIRAGEGTTVAPPWCPGVGQTRDLRDAPTLALQGLGRFAHTTRKAFSNRQLLRCLGFGYLTIVAVVLWPVLVLPWRVCELRSPRHVTYVDRDGRGRILAALTIKAGPGSQWTVGNHTARRPGTGQGRHLRERLIPALISAADVHGVTVHAVAATTELAATYCRAVPGLVDVGPNRPFGRRLQRDPQTFVDAP